MEYINAILETDIIRWLYIGIILVCGLNFGIEQLSKISNSIGKPIKWLNRNTKDHDLLMSAINRIAELEERHTEDNKQSIKHDKIIKSDLENIKAMIYDQMICSWRFEILDMASAISLGRNYSKEQYDHIIEIYEKYEDLLAMLGQKNGKVDASMEVIMDSYKYNLKNGF